MTKTSFTSETRMRVYFIIEDEARPSKNDSCIELHHVNKTPTAKKLSRTLDFDFRSVGYDVYIVTPLAPYDSKATVTQTPCSHV